MVLIQNTRDLSGVARDLLQNMPPLKMAAIITLSGDLGAGKTTFVQALAAELGVMEAVTSPTFVIERVYELPPKKGHGFKHLIHVDAYRLKNAQDMERLGWSDRLRDPRNLILIEWPEHIASVIPPSATKITLSYVDETSRHLSYDQ